MSAGAGADWISAGQAAAGLEMQFPGWTVGTLHARGGARFEAYRRDTAPGLCAVIGTYKEVRAELLAASRRAGQAAS